MFGKALHGAFLAGIFCSVLLACGVAIAAWHPPADVPEVREKLAWFSAHADDYDTLFFGTSRIYREVMPAVFDQATAEAGEPAHAFNFGIDGMFPPEDGYVFDVLRARHPTRLRWVFVELSMFTTGFVDRDPDSIRAAYWHDWKRTKLITHAALSHRGKPAKTALRQRGRRTASGRGADAHPFVWSAGAQLGRG